MAGSFLIRPTVRLYWLKAAPVVVDAGGAGGFGAADVDAGGGGAADVVAGAGGLGGVVDDAVCVGAAAAVDDGEAALVVEVVAVPVQPVNITIITTMPTSAEKNFLTLFFLLIQIIISSL